MDDRLNRPYDEATRWRDEGLALRRILLDCALEETRKWNKPCYTAGGDNIAIVQRMKDFLALMFFKGALVDDPEALLRSQGPHSRSAKRIELTSVEQIEAQEPAIRALIASAIAVAEQGLTVDEPPSMPDVEELEAAFDADPTLREAFEALTPGRQRSWLLHFSSAKQSATRTRRIDKAIPAIRAGRGKNG